MARAIQYTIFLSRPSDVESHADSVKQAVQDTNLVASALGLRFEVFDWKEDATPGLASEPQARVNEQSNDHDAIIAILGATLGTPTANHPSGTVEEIERSIVKSSSSVFGSNSVMIFFKDVNLSLSSDLDEAKRVKDLKNSLGPRGILYRTFSDDDALRDGVMKSLGVLIANHVHLTESLGPPIGNPGRVSEVGLEVALPDVEELGIMDFGQIISEKILSATDAAEEVRQALEKLADQTARAADETKLANASENNARKREIVDEVAKALHECSDRIEGRGLQMSSDFGSALDAMRSILDIQAADISPEIAGTEANIVLSLTDTLEPTIETTSNQIREFGSTVASLPRLTKELNNAKRRLLKLIEELVGELEKLRADNKALHTFATARATGSAEATD